MNEYVIAVYRSRSVSTKVYNYLTNHGVMCALVSTPRNANVGCGLSVKLRKTDLPVLYNVLQQTETFVGFFLVKNSGGKSIVTRM